MNESLNSFLIVFLRSFSCITLSSITLLFVVRSALPTFSCPFLLFLLFLHNHLPPLAAASRHQTPHTHMHHAHFIFPFAHILFPALLLKLLLLLLLLFFLFSCPDLLLSHATGPLVPPPSHPSCLPPSLSSTCKRREERKGGERGEGRPLVLISSPPRRRLGPSRRLGHDNLVNPQHRQRRIHRQPQRRVLHKQRVENTSLPLP